MSMYSIKAAQIVEFCVLNSPSVRDSSLQDYVTFDIHQNVNNFVN